MNLVTSSISCFPASDDDGLARATTSKRSTVALFANLAGWTIGVDHDGIPSLERTRIGLLVQSTAWYRNRKGWKYRHVNERTLVLTFNGIFTRLSARQSKRYVTVA
jgi:hypothetical protein